MELYKWLDIHILEGATATGVVSASTAYIFQSDLADLDAQIAEAINGYAEDLGLEGRPREILLEKLPGLLKDLAESVGEGKKPRDKAPDKTISVDFKQNEIVVNGRDHISKEGKLTLAEYIILKGKETKVHWLWAYIVLDKFRVSEAKLRFRQYIHSKKILLAGYGMHIEALRKEQDNFAKLDSIEDRVVSNIKEVTSDYQEAKSLDKEGKVLQAIQKLSSLTDNEDHNWYTFIDAYGDI